MSAPLFQADILFTQRLLASCGLYDGKLDGKHGPKTQGALDAFDAFYSETASELGTFDVRSEAVIATLLPKAQVAVRKCMNAAKGAPFVVKLLSGTRSYAEQDVLFAKKPKVTNARGGQSNHNFGIAWDVGIFVNGVYYEGKNAKEDKAYADLAKIVKAAVPGVDWGGDWKSFKDMPHYQLSSGKSVEQCRLLLEQGRAYV
jgi:peptidoglycan L-alanyl-D-glutamate endopeptidase CwlK